MDTLPVKPKPPRLSVRGMPACSSGVCDCGVFNCTSAAQFQYTVTAPDHILPHIILGKLGEAGCRMPYVVGPTDGRATGESPAAGESGEGAVVGRAVSLLGEECTLLGGEVVPAFLHPCARGM
jgi:hypothetical protein